MCVTFSSRGGATGSALPPPLGAGAAPHDFGGAISYSVFIDGGRDRVSATEDTIIHFLTAKAKAAWEEEQPYLLSFAGPDLTDAQIDYRSILDGERLKAFVERTSGEGRYQLVKHPHQKAKVGLVPHGTEFQFDDVEQEESSVSRDTSRSTQPQGSTLLEFLNALSKLPSDDLDGVVIPTRVLVKLARKR